MRKKIHIKKNDTVVVISGNDKGSKGRVLEVNYDSYRAIVEGVNMISRHTKPNAKHPDGGIIKKEAAVHISNLMLIDSTGNATRIGRRVDEKTNKLVRYSKKTKEVIK